MEHDVYRFTARGEQLERVLRAATSCLRTWYATGGQPTPKNQAQRRALVALCEAIDQVEGAPSPTADTADNDETAGVKAAIHRLPRRYLVAYDLYVLALEQKPELATGRDQDVYDYIVEHLWDEDERGKMPSFATFVRNLRGGRSAVEGPKNQRRSAENPTPSAPRHRGTRIQGEGRSLKGAAMHPVHYVVDKYHVATPMTEVLDDLRGRVRRARAKGRQISKREEKALLRAARARHRSNLTQYRAVMLGGPANPRR